MTATLWPELSRPTRKPLRPIAVGSNQPIKRRSDALGGPWGVFYWLVSRHKKGWLPTATLEERLECIPSYHPRDVTDCKPSLKALVAQACWLLFVELLLFCSAARKWKQASR